MRVNLTAIIEILVAMGTWYALFAAGICPDIDSPWATLVIGIVLLVMDGLIAAGSGGEVEDGKGGWAGFFPVWLGGIITITYSIYGIGGAAACLGLVGIGVVLFLILAVAGGNLEKEKKAKKAAEEGKQRKESDRQETRAVQKGDPEPFQWSQEASASGQEAPLKLAQEERPAPQESRPAPDPLQWIPCKRCDGYVPVYTTQRPTVVSCPDCGRKYKLS